MGAKMGSYNQSYLGMPTPQAVGQAQNAAQTGTSSVPGGGSTAGQSPQSGAARGTLGAGVQSPTDYSGGSPYLQGLNYGGTIGQTQSQQPRQVPQGSMNIFGNSTPQALQGIPMIRQLPGGQWGDGEGNVYDPQSGRVLYSAGAAGSTGPGTYFGANGQQSTTPFAGYNQMSGYRGGAMTPTMTPQQAYTTGNLQQKSIQDFLQSIQRPQQQPQGGMLGMPQNNRLAGLQALPQGPQGVGPGQNPLAQPINQIGGGQMTTGTPVGPAQMSASSYSPMAQISSWGAGQSGIDPNVVAGQVGAGQTGGTNFPYSGGPAYGGQQGAFPNTYGGQFQNNAPAFNPTVPATMYSGNNGPQQGAVGRPPEGYGVVPPFSPAMSQTYFQWLMNQAGNLGQGIGATPYGQQNTFLPSQGTSGMTGLSAPMSPFAQYAQNALTSNIGNIGNLLDPNNLQAMMAQYQPLMQQASLQSQYGARGNPGDPYGLYNGAQALQGSASGIGLPGLTGQYLNSAMQYGGMGLPAETQSAFAQYGAGPGAGGTTLSNMAQTGLPTDATPAWQAMVAAQQRNIEQNAAQIREKMGLSGNLGLTQGPGGAGTTAALGTPYGTALTDFYAQTALGQNAQLTQAQQQAQEAARQRMLGAAGTMSGQQLGAAQNLGALQQQAGLFGAGQQTANSQYLQNLMAQGLGQQGQFTAMGQQIPSQIYQNYLQQMGGQIGNALNLGQQYQNLDQNAINRQYQEFLRTQPEYSPLLQQLFAGATTFPGMVSTQFPSGIGTAIGQGLGGYFGGQMGQGFAGGGQQSGGGGGMGGEAAGLGIGATLALLGAFI